MSYVDDYQRCLLQTSSIPSSSTRPDFILSNPFRVAKIDHSSKNISSHSEYMNHAIRKRSGGYMNNIFNQIQPNRKNNNAITFDFVDSDNESFHDIRTNLTHPSGSVPLNEQTNNTNKLKAKRFFTPSNMSATIKQQPFSPGPYSTFSNDFYNTNNNHQHHHRHSAASRENEHTSPVPNIIPHKNTATGSKSPDDTRHCAVCSDTASGYHYGVWSCEGCKAFFKRSIQGTNEYVCPATNTCTIDKHRRKSCQACRLRRCYEVGMTKGTTRRERKFRKKAVSVCKITSTSNAATSSSSGNNPEHGSLAPISQTEIPSGSQNNNHYSNGNAFSSPQLQMNKTSPPVIRTPTATTEFLTALSQASRLNLPAKFDANRQLDDQYFLQTLAKAFDQELVVLINWAKRMPGYTESLTLDQQVTIIEQSWLDALLLDVIERSIERHDDALQFAPDFIIARNRDLSSPITISICTYLFNLVQAFKDPRTTHDEFIALKAAVLINSIPVGTSSTKAFRILTNQIYQTIQYSCDHNSSFYHDSYIRHFSLLLQLPHIKILSSKLIRLFLDMRSNESLPQADLLLEMLDAQDIFDASFDVDGNSVSSHQANSEQNSKSNNNMPTASFATENPSLYSDDFSTMETAVDTETDRSKTQPPSTAPLQFYRKTSTSSI